MVELINAKNRGGVALEANKTKGNILNVIFVW